MKNFRAFTDDNGFNLPVIDAPDYIDYRVLGAAAAETHTVPAGAKVCVVIPNADCYIKASAATTPAADVTDGTGQMYCPAGAARVFPCATGSRYISAGGFSIISAVACIVALEFYE